MRNIKLTVAYDGTNYHGFQEQRGTGLATIQETLEQCLGRLARRRVQVIGAGRTDSGVHARGQVVNFDASGWPIPVERIPLALNGLLPGDIVVTQAREVEENFHARICARSKTYRYTIWNSGIPSPFHRLYSCFWPVSLDAEAMSAACTYLEGTHDFKCFQASGATVKTTVRTLYQARVIREGPVIHFVFNGDGFLYNMVRIMAGTLLQVGMGKIKPESIKTLIESRKRALAGPTLPPQGLCLERVEY
ncbi:tRNA pseudouridine(38-40) synthase TruA [Desulfallas thermosapovorans]|uniref:tRNA pseudouridine synthase A n=1 Tax=Desulfallas thermosapovorans DSM 6562 TaxID=1121431 RepID=A0A5S4ZNT0_9FIRM|nr:tRNA pseudouridine(38-40) synthase TruA [Desulfallas thermosapovorans]TYO93814.1 tRNA pseudouridine38-40 synthase [Desulfallas thermosapovorans DSM 6562]